MGKRPIPKPFVRLRRRTFLLTFNVAILALGVPVLVQAFNAVTVSGFPLGFYLVAQGVPVLLGVLLFLFVIRADRIEDAGRNEGTRGFRGDRGA